jgi:hypothetical protein
VAVSLRCSDADGDAVTRSIVSGPAHGSLSAINDAAGTVTYTPAAGFTGMDTFAYAASDGVNHSAAATATITVTRAALSSLRVSPSRFSLAGRRVKGRCVKPTTKNSGDKRCRRPVRLRVGYTLNLGATVTFTLKRQASGRNVNGRCVKPTKKNSKHRKCLLSLPGKITLPGKSGANHFTFNGKIGGHQLGPGTYELIATPTGGKPRNVTFNIVP